MDIDLTEMESDSPLLWIRIDPDLELIRSVRFEQPDMMWQYMLKHERCVIAQSQVRMTVTSFVYTNNCVTLLIS